MRLLTASLIILGVGSLSCSGLEPWSRARIDAPLAATTATSATAAISATAAPDALEPGPRTLDQNRMALVAVRALSDRVRDNILSELVARHTGLSNDELRTLADTIIEEAKRHSIDPTLVLAVIKVESGGYHLAVSPVGALGLMQLLPSTAEELARKHGHTWRGANSLFDPILNVKLGTAYLSQLENKYGSMTTALAAYNWGPGRIDRKLRRGDAVPRLYREKVMKFYEAGSRTLASTSRS